MQTFCANPADWSDNDLNWLKPFSESKIIALGEAVHTSDGFYSAKVRLIKYLVENHNYRAISFESPWGKALSATRFIQDGQGTVEDALKGLFRVWRAKSVENLLLWLRQWNIDNPQDQIRFFGNDTQQPDWDLEFLLNSSLISSDEKNDLKRLVSATFGESIFQERYGASEEFKKLMAEGFAENQDQTSEIMELIGRWSFPKDSLEYVALISLSASVLGLSKDIHGTAKDIVQLRGESFAHRDKCMSDLTLHFAGTDKTILWAHNIHISRPSEKLAEGLYYQGQFLQKSLKDQYQAIALTASKIETNWPWLPSHMRGPILPEDSLEKALANQFPNQSVFLANIGDIKCANYSESFNFSEDRDISARFDGLIVLPKSAPIEYAIVP